MKKCCGCIDLTLGAKIIGVLYSIYSIIGIIICYLGVSDYPAFRDYIKSIWPESGLLDCLQLNPILIFLRIIADTKFGLLFFLIPGFLAYIVSLVGSVLLVIGAQIKNHEDMTLWLQCEVVDVIVKILFLFYFEIPLLIIPIAFDIYSFICVSSLVHQWYGEDDDDGSKSEDDDDCSALICCLCII
jgi:hypothetical protein